MKYRIDREAGRQLRSIVKAFRLDLEAIDEYYRLERPEDWPVYNTVTLEAARDELEQLRDLVDGLIERTDRGSSRAERSALREPLRELASGLPLIQRHVEGDVDPEELDSEDYREEEEKLVARQRALSAILGDGGLFEIFRWVCENEGNNAEKRVPDRVMAGGGLTWKAAIGRYLKDGRDGHGLVEEHRWDYLLTDRGEHVERALTGLLESDVVDELATDETSSREAVTEPDDLDELAEVLGGETTRREAALTLMAQHFSIDEWG